MGIATVRNVSWPARLGAFVVASLFAIGVAGGALAQETTPDPNAILSHPAHIHAGSCADLDPNPKAPLNDVGPRLTGDGELPASEDIKGSLEAMPVEISETEDVEISFDDMLGESHALNVHESAQAPQNYIACGDIGGAVIDDKVMFGLAEQNDSGYSGVAIIEKDGDDHVKVTVYLSRAPETNAVPDATPTA
jgi:hypothetical protein